MSATRYLLPRADLIRTGPVDHADWSYRLGLGWVSNQRVRLATKLLRGLPRDGDLLEIGYGSGIHMPVWAQFGHRIHGLDIHGHAGEVSGVLARHGVAADLRTGSAESMPFGNASFDIVLAVSVLEFFEDLPAACREIRRVLRPGGRFIVVTPGKSSLLDFALHVVTGESADRDFGDRRERVLDTVTSCFDVVERLRFPRLSGRAVRLYVALSLSASERGAD